jgi:hypothetical protein
MHIYCAEIFFFVRQINIHIRIDRMSEQERVRIIFYVEREREI